MFSGLGSPAGRGGRFRLLALLGCAVVVVAASLLMFPGQPTATPITQPVHTVAYLRTPEPGDDFPRLPPECYDRAGSPRLSPCRVTHTRSASTVVVWGDSHAWMYLPALRRAAAARHDNLVMIVAGGCPPAVPEPRTAGSDYTLCEQHDADTLAYLRRLHEHSRNFEVILSAFWSGYRAGTYVDSVSQDSHSTEYAQRMVTLADDGTAPLFADLARMRIRVDVIGQAATVPENPPACAAGREPYECDLPRTSALGDEADNRRWLEQLMRPLAGQPRYIDPSGAYCDARVCRPRVDGVNTFYDDIHLGAGLTRTMTRYFLPAFGDLHRPVDTVTGN